MEEFFRKVQAALKDQSLRKKILFIFVAIVFFRALANIPIPGMDPSRLQAFLSQSQFLGLLNIFSGGGLANMSIVMVGVAAFITASIIMQLLTVLSPKLKALLHEEGDIGRRRFYQYARILTLPLALVQAFGLITLLQTNGVLPPFTPFETLLNVIVISAGSILLMWIGELITEFGIGNGVSIIIFAGIVAAIPGSISQILFTYDPSQIPVYAGFIAAALAIIAGATLVTEAERPVPIIYAKRVRGAKSSSGISTYLPIRVNQAGVMPIIFALSLLLFPRIGANFLVKMQSPTAQHIGQTVLNLFQNGWFYSIFYFILVFLFTFFYKSIMFEPDTVATNLQKSGAFIPGVRPGQTTAEYIGQISNRVTLVGAAFLSLLAVLPLAMQAATGNSTLAIGGTAVLIVVNVILDVVKKVDAQITMREY
ncbi:MAG TPA: preprotein translocase subunit SecY [Candidatus Paceibacterota bacterium]|nr:preprotein translocase subunit SecY [Candidatus Paceibacterota bacterium]